MTEITHPEQRLSFQQLSEEQRAQYVPEQVFDLRKNEPAFIFNRDNLIAIKRYEKAIRKLPTADAAIPESVMSLVSASKQDIDVLFDNLRKHADSWDGVEDACKSLGADLQIFAETLVAEATKLIALIKTMDTWDATAGQHAIELPVRDGETFKQAVARHMGVIREEIAYKRKSIQHVKQLVDHFGDAISENLLPMARGLRDKMLHSQFTEALTQLDAKLTVLDSEIQKKLDEYKSLVGLSFTGLVFGPLGLAITGGIYGKQAEAVRAEKNKKIRERSELVEQKSKLQDYFPIIEKVTTDIADMAFRLVDVRTATANLEDVWVLLDAYAKNSQRRAEAVSTNHDVKRFVEQFERVINPWKNIQGISKDISKLFNETLIDFERKFQNGK
ncbi:hypothetical protein F3J44_05500 [Pantoea sp. Tr-811]|uniref:alpha-xenorhabdolysin family binary toxin subunit A n=1 Tax=Pantoea sp. Tr-811 TaxID=2608361 RepID=UPI0014213859|nr:alpha-xenorhabdolysin family binary toxin subunit A [Pantoea sp. Tr-811]NIF25836.1 hypothetical protein [Pantoea sp. Tr-811]